MKRAAIERPRTLRVWREYQRIMREWDSQNGEAYRSGVQPGRFRKTHRLGGCGNSRCFVCHSDKLHRVPTRQERRAEMLQFD